MGQEIEQPAFVLHSRPYRETSLLVTFFTEDYGKQNSIVKGVRSGSKSAKAKQAWLQPFQSLNLSWLEKNTARSDLLLLRDMEPSTIRFPLFGEANLCGLYLNELLYRLLYPSLSAPDLFECYQQTLYQLAKSENRAQQAWALRKFEFALLSELGFAFDLQHSHDGQIIHAEQEYLFFPELGFFHRDQIDSGEERQKGVKISGECLQKFREQSFCEPCLPALKRLFKLCLAPYLGQHPIQARSLFQVLSEGRNKL